MSDLKLNIGENKYNAAKSKRGYQKFFNWFSINEDENKVEQQFMSLSDEPQEGAYSMEVSGKGNINDSCSYLYYTVCFGTWIMFWIGLELGSSTIYFLILALFGIYVNAATMPNRMEESNAQSVQDKICTCAKIQVEGFQREIISVPGPSTVS
ncbi:hypothetical protein JTB14_036824 [Gonioctena quinquepunctata]|nr:hypothetical protein JTB14_036824 [Gonioctena quinquepunctata]